MIRRFAAAVLAVILLFALPVSASAPTFEATILFTHDLHSHLLPSAAEEEAPTAAMPG